MARYSRRQFLAAAAITAGQLLVGRAALADSDWRLRRPFNALSAIERRALEAEALANPRPLVTPIGTSDEILWPNSYRKLISKTAVTLYDSPGGSPVKTIPAGFNYVTIGRVEGDWTEINYREWVPNELITDANVSAFTGVTFDSAPAFPLAWMLLDTRPSAAPGVSPNRETPKLERYTMVNVFAEQRVDGWLWYMVGPSQWVEQRRIGKAILIPPPQGVSGRWIGVDLYEQVLVAYEDHTPIFATLISSGLEEWPTDEGLYRINPSLRFESTPMRGALGGPDSYIIEDIPWTMFFNEFSEEALHGTFWHDGFGYRHSHGCVNMTITDARWVYQWTAQDYEDAWVYIYSSGQYA